MRALWCDDIHLLHLLQAHIRPEQCETDESGCATHEECHVLATLFANVLAPRRRNETENTSVEGRSHSPRLAKKSLLHSSTVNECNGHVTFINATLLVVVDLVVAWFY